MKQEEHDISLVQSTKDKFQKARQYDDYLHRHPCLQRVSLYEFVSKYERVKRLSQAVLGFDQAVEIDIEGGQKNTFLGFKEGHPLFHSHALRQRRKTVVPDLIGPRIPDRTKLEDLHENEKYSLILLILFCPFDEDDSILRGYNSFSEARMAFENSDYYSAYAERYVENLQEYYVSKMAASERRKLSIQNRLQDDVEGDDNNVEWVGDADNVFEMQDGCDISGEFSDSPTIFEVAAFGVSLPFSQTTETFMKSKVLKVCLEEKEKVFVSGSSKRGVWPKVEMTSNDEMYLAIDKDVMQLNSAAVVLEMAEMKRLSVEGIGSAGAPEATQLEELDMLAYMPPSSTNITMVDLLDNAMEKENLSIANYTPLSLRFHERYSEEDIQSLDRHKTYPTILDVAKIFTLNEYQFYAFRMAAVHFLQKLRKGHLSNGHGSVNMAELGRNGFQLYIGGEGGTGKSRIVEALLHLCNYWNQPKAIRTCAPTGIAASVVHGQTFHSLVGMAGNNGYKSHHRISSDAIDAFAPVQILILDEVSMLGRSELSILDTHLRRLKECNDTKFGGVGVIFCGDFFQIPPVKKSPVYINPCLQQQHHVVHDERKQFNTYTEGKAIDGRDLIGFNIWRDIRNVILLKETMRYANDPLYGSIMGRLRTGKCTEEDWTLLNSRVLREESSKELTDRFIGNVPLVVKGNELRHALNWQSVSSMGKSLGMTPVVCVAKMSPIRGAPFNSAEVRKLLTVGDQKTYNLAVLLPLLPGMPVRITQNIAVSLGIANGTDGILKGVQFPEGTTFKSINCFGIRVLLSSHLPSVAFVNSPQLGSRLPRRFQCVPLQFPDSTIPLYPFESSSFSSPNSLENRASMKMTQLPFVPAFASTTYKVQGLTTDGIVAFPFLKGSPGRPSTAALYVVLSRVRRLKDVFLMRQITQAERQYFVPRPELLNEQSRLVELHQLTLNIQSNI